MKVISTKELVYDANREGIKQGFIEIELLIESRDDINKTVKLKAIDRIILHKGEVVEDDNYPEMNGRSLESSVIINQKYYDKTYAEYDTQRAYLLSQDTSGLTGLELDDKLLQDALLYSLEIDPIYSAVGSDWERR